MDLQDKPRPPPQINGEREDFKIEAFAKKIKAPDSKTEYRGGLMSDDQLPKAYYKKGLHTFLINATVMRVLRPKILGELQGPVSPPAAGSNKLSATKALMRLLKATAVFAGSFEAEALFDLKLSEIKQSVQSLFELLASLVGEPDQAQKQPTQSTSTATRSALMAATLTPINPRDTLEAVVNSDRHPPEKLELFFQAAMERFLNEQQVPQTRSKPISTGDQDVDMESVGSPDQPITAWEYDPDDLDLGRPARATVATTAATTSGHATNTPRIRVSATLELNEFAGKDGDEDRARSWLGKVKSAFIRDQAPDQEKCLVFGNLLTGPAQNWYRQLSRTTRNTWKGLHQSFQVQYCGRGLSVARQYYHARKRSDESPLEYLHRPNVAGLCTRLQIKDGPPDVRREHVEHFIETLDDRDLADLLAFLRIPDADTLGEVLRSRQRAKSRQSKTVYGSIKPRQKTPATAAGTRAVRAVHVPGDSSDSDEVSRSSSDEDLRRVYHASRLEQDNPQDQHIRDQAQASHQQDRHISQYPRQTDEKTSSKRCSHCGSRKYDDLGCWRRLTCDKCGKRGHSSDRCLFVCRACGEIHDADKCPMEEFYNLIRQWYNPTKHGGTLPESSEKMLN
ncbi:unnamed protein product [Phytophthora fragariaefolia]|uniref:Unnamed protein product n=1 Tax=Phytophthora fragariaefolia TaxID=1490495 RepID=A0A9W6U0S4_9STRA|nr:unnamed protein product [Phytophthora fragariaefolia]